MKRLVCLCVLMTLCLPGLFKVSAAETPPAPIPLQVVLYDPCGGCAASPSGCGDCKIITEYFDRLHLLLKPLFESGDVTLSFLNLRTPDGLEGHKALCEAFALPKDEQLKLPLYFLGSADKGLVLSRQKSEFLLNEKLMALLVQRDADALKKAAAAPAATGAPSAGVTPRPKVEDPVIPRNDSILDLQDDDSLVIYFFKDFCPYCKTLRPLFEALPQWLTLPDGRRSRLKFVSLEKQDPAQMAIVQSYYDKMKIDKERQFVPMIVIGDKALFLYKEIVPELLPLLLSGEGLKTDRNLLAPLLIP